MASERKFGTTSGHLRRGNFVGFRVKRPAKAFSVLPELLCKYKTWKQDYNEVHKRLQKIVVDNPVYRRIVCPLNRNDTLPAQSSPAEAALSRKPRRKIKQLGMQKLPHEGNTFFRAAMGLLAAGHLVRDEAFAGVARSSTFGFRLRRRTV